MGGTDGMVRRMRLRSGRKAEAGGTAAQETGGRLPSLKRSEMKLKKPEGSGAKPEKPERSGAEQENSERSGVKSERLERSEVKLENSETSGLKPEKLERPERPGVKPEKLERLERLGVEQEKAELERLETEGVHKKSQNLMHLIKRVHGLVEKSDLEKHRQSQDYIGTILSNAKDIRYREVDIDGMYGEWVGVNRAHMKKYVILHCHGGGYSTGSSLYARTLTSKLAASTSMDVLCFDYRLAPEHPYPAAPEDAMKAWNYLMLLGYGARDVILTGDSAGGNLALSLTLNLKRQGRLLPRGLVLMSPWTDLTSSGKSFQTKAEVDPVLDKAYIDRMVGAYACGRELQDPFISPLFGDFAGFPPVYIQVGENEILLSDSLRLHQAFVEANVPVRLDVCQGMWHVFQMSPMKAARAAMDKNAEFIYDICR